MLIAETKTWQLGRYTVRQQPRFDNPYWAQFLIFSGDKLIGSMFSAPDLGACQSLEREKRDERVQSKALAGSSDGRRGRRYGKARPSELDARANLLVIRELDD